MRTIAVANQKGGCGKTTTTVNLAGCLSADGARVLVVDFDPQAHATLALGIDPERLDRNLYEVLAGGLVPVRDVIVEARPNLQVAPSGIALSAIEPKLSSEPVELRTSRLSSALDRVGVDFDYVLIDCPPSLGLLTFNALRAAGEVIVPLETSYFAIHGVQKLLETIALLTERIGHDLGVRILPTLYDGRTRCGRQILSEIREMFKDLCFDTVIRQNVKLREAAGRGKPINRIARSANGTIDYSALAVEVGAGFHVEVEPASAGVDSSRLLEQFEISRVAPPQNDLVLEDRRLPAASLRAGHPVGGPSPRTLPGLRGTGRLLPQGVRVRLRLGAREGCKRRLRFDMNPKTQLGLPCRRHVFRLTRSCVRAKSLPRYTNSHM